MASKTGTSRRLAQRIGAFVIVMATLAALVGVSTSPASAVDVSGGVVGGFEVDGNEVVSDVRTRTALPEPALVLASLRPIFRPG
jgi:hypothetical protein